MKCNLYSTSETLCFHTPDHTPVLHPCLSKNVFASDILQTVYELQVLLSWPPESPPRMIFLLCQARLQIPCTEHF